MAYLHRLLRQSSRQLLVLLLFAENVLLRFLQSILLLRQSNQVIRLYPFEQVPQLSLFLYPLLVQVLKCSLHVAQSFSPGPLSRHYVLAVLASIIKITDLNFLLLNFFLCPD